MAIAKEYKVVHGSDLSRVAAWAESKFVLKETGKGLSSNDFSAAYKAMLDTIDSAPTSGSGNLVTSGGVKSALDGYLPLTGGTMSGHVTFEGGELEPVINFDINKAVSGGGGWAYAPINIRDAGNSRLFNIGVFGGNADLAYAFLGLDDYNGEHNLRINASGLSWGSNTVWHQGNDGADSGLDADLLDGWHGERYVSYNDDTLGNDVDFNAITYKCNNSIVIQPIHVPNYSGQTNYPYNGYGQMLTFGGQESLFPFRIAHINNSRLYYQRAGYKESQTFDFSGGSAWEQIAFTSSNVASATKLETARTIWGRSFDGTGNVDGLLTANLQAGAAGTAIQINDSISQGYSAIRFAVNNAYEATIQYLKNVNDNPLGQHVLSLDPVSGGDTTPSFAFVSLGLWTNPALWVDCTNYRVGVGTTSPAYRLDVAGDIRGTSVTTTLQTSQPSGGMLPNRQYALGELSGDTTFSMAAGASGVTNHYYWTFSTPSTAPTITWPAAITSWYGGSAPTINASKHYEVSVLDGVAICMEV